MKYSTTLGTCLALIAVAACGGVSEESGKNADVGQGKAEQADRSSGNGEGEEDHAHPEEPLGTVRIGDHQVELAQGHGGVKAGEEAHLVVKLPYSDQGATVVRAWIGTEDRMRSLVGKGEYAPAHDDYDIHATAPDPLPQGAKWWIEIEKPDGTKQVGSVDPIFE